MISLIHDGILTRQAYNGGSGWGVSLGTWLKTTNTVFTLDLEFEDIPADAGFNNTCYRRFTDAMSKVERHYFWWNGSHTGHAIQTRYIWRACRDHRQLQNILHLSLQHKCCTRIDFVIDQYPLISIKNLEWSRRADAGSQFMQIFGPGSEDPNPMEKVSLWRNK